MRVLLKNVRVAFCNSLFEAEQYQGAGPFRHSATFLVEKGSDNDKAIESAIKIEAEKAYAKKAEATLKSMRGNSNKFAYQDGDNKPDYSGFAGHMSIAAHRKSADGAPTVIDRNKDALGKDSGKIYGGCNVNASIDIYAQSGDNPGIRCGLLGVQFHSDNDSFGGASKGSADDFDAMEDLDDLL